MGAECVGARLKDDLAALSSIPPDSGSFKRVTLQRVHHDVKASAYPDPGQTRMNIDCNNFSSNKFEKSLQRKSNIGQFYNSLEDEESDSELLEQEVPSIGCLPKGVFRGCAQCEDCQKVTTKWRPENSCRPALDDVPVFYPTEEEFEDTHKYIASIRPTAEQYGICRIVPPPSWTVPCLLKEKGLWENTKFATRIQQVDKLQNREPVRKIRKTWGTMRAKRQKLMEPRSEYTKGNENILERDEHASQNDTERFGFEPGPDFTVEQFQKYAHDFATQYFHTDIMDGDSGSRQWEPSVEEIEGEYWRIVEEPTEEIEVLYGADLEAETFGNCFSRSPSPSENSNIKDQYVKSGWNLNNTPRLPGSMLSFESGNISGVVVPWWYFGMCFSSFCWHVEDHHFYSLNYMHWGAPKIWYGVPGRDALKLEGAMKKHLAGLFAEQPDLLHNLVTQFSPSMLKSEGVPVYRCIQKSGEFVLTFPRAYHSGFSCGFNCAEAVNIAPVDWLPHGQNAVELYREQGRKVTISHDKLLLDAARATVRAQWDILFFQKNTQDNLRWKNVGGVDGILTKALKARTEMECVRREYLCNSSQSRKMNPSFDSNCERECIVCHYDLHLSAVGCSCSPDIHVCLVHSKQLCLCPWEKRFFLFRYEISEMNVLVDAVGGKFSAVHKWGHADLGLSLSSYVKKKNEESEKSLEGKKHEKEAIYQGILTRRARENRGAQSIKEEKDTDTCSSSFSSNQPSQEGNVVSIICQRLSSGNRNLLGLFPQGSPNITSSMEMLVANPVQKLAECHLQPSQFSRDENLNSERKDGIIESEFENNLSDRGKSIMAISSYSSNNIDSSNQRPNRPCMAMVVRRIKCTVEPMEYGTALSGNLWSTRQNIFPKGYRSRVRYFSVLDPTQMCYYISQILDAGLPGPLFMVVVEQCQSEVFIHVSATKCWDMIRERVNDEIRIRQSLGKWDLPLQPPGSVDGLEMFGFSSPNIVQAIEAMDRDHVCSEYWASKSRDLATSVPSTVTNSSRLDITQCNKSLFPSSAALLGGLFKKANLGELLALQSVLRSDKPDTNEEFTQRLDEEMLRKLE